MHASQNAIDFNHLKQQAADNIDVMREVLGLFFEQCETMTSELTRSHDPALWKQWGHTLKGAARGVGAFEVAKAAALIEQGPCERQKIDSLNEAIVAARTFAQKHPL